jgi:hypothetical protein
MTDHLGKQFAGYMTACYGAAWALRIPSDQLAETRQAFYMGALSYQGLVLGILDPATDTAQGDLTDGEAARGEAMFAEIAAEIETFGERRIFDLFARATNGGGNA